VGIVKDRRIQGKLYQRKKPDMRINGNIMISGSGHGWGYSCKREKKIK